MEQPRARLVADRERPDRELVNQPPGWPAEMERAGAMSLVWTVASIAIAAALGTLALRAKLKRDALRQDGQVVGSALYGGMTGDGEALFVMLRGEPTFRADAPFEHGGRHYLLVSYEAYNDHSSVLRRFSNARCQMIE